MIFRCGFSNFFSVLTQEQQAMLKMNHWAAVQLVLRIQIKSMEMEYNSFETSTSTFRYKLA